MAKKWIDGINVPAMESFLADLRSGQYMQGKHTLREKGEFCCLGVMTEGVKDQIGITDSTYRNGYKFNGETFTGLPPIEVLRHLGIPETHIIKIGATEGNVKLIRHDKETQHPDVEPEFTWATALNDMHFRTFEEIADRFEETFTVEVDD